MFSQTESNWAPLSGINVLRVNSPLFHCPQKPDGTPDARVIEVNGRPVTETIDHSAAWSTVFQIRFRSASQRTSDLSFPRQFWTKTVTSGGITTGSILIPGPANQTATLVDWFCPSDNAGRILEQSDTVFQQQLTGGGSQSSVSVWQSFHHW